MGKTLVNQRFAHIIIKKYISIVAVGGVYEGLNFSRIVVGAAGSRFAWFCSLLRASWAAEGAR